MNVPYLFSVCFALLLFILIVWSILEFIVLSTFYAIAQFVENIRINRLGKFPDKLKQKYEAVLLKHIPYYVSLSEKSKAKFLTRLNHFVMTRQFAAEDGLAATDEMKTLISATAIQLTFGLEYYYLNHFRKIIIRKDVYHNAQTDQDHLGETSMKGYITLSWKYFMEGYAEPSDKLNVGLHEMAHALDLSRIVGDIDNYFTVYYNKWYFVSKDEFDEMQDRPSFLRDYAGANMREFFAVCVEHFFEAPKEFKEQLPDVYKHLSTLLRQDPLKSIETQQQDMRDNNNIITVEQIRTPLQFSSEISLWDSLLAVGTLLARTVITLFVFLVAYKNNLFSIILVVMFLVYYFNALLMTKFELGSNFLIIRRPLLFNKAQAFYFDNMISVRFSHGGTDNVSITYFDMGEIKTFKSLCSIRQVDEEYLLSFLGSKKILTHLND